MRAVLDMPRQKKSDGPSAGGKPKGKFTKAVKLREPFYEQLDKVAQRKKRPPGDLIEEHMKQWVKGEYAKALADEEKEIAAKIAALKKLDE